MSSNARLTLLHPSQLSRPGARVAWLGRRGKKNLEGAQTNFSLIFKNEDQKTKKGLRREILGSVFVFTRVFLLGTKFNSRFRRHRQYFGGLRPRNALQWHRAWYFLLGRAQPSLGRHTSRLGSTLLAWGAQAVVWGGTARKCPPRGAGPATQNDTE